ncbi:hypothetical protein VNO77_33041 [Canavalia gladiata]|uniref:Uncharacterized protein n=1 Tax=Canavalia gladiata TaxID=3824 RepID=A0AAN9KB01_CANGL
MLYMYLCSSHLFFLDNLMLSLDFLRLTDCSDTSKDGIFSLSLSLCLGNIFCFTIMNMGLSSCLADPTSAPSTCSLWLLLRVRCILRPVQQK